MIDIESLVFDTFQKQFVILHQEADVTGGFDEEKATYPTVVVREINNQPYQASATDECAENHTRVTYEVEVVSNKTDTGRSECKQLLNDADNIMQSMKFRRIHKNEAVKINRSRWRQYARYEAVVGKPYTVDAGTENEKTVYPMYRR